MMGLEQNWRDRSHVWVYATLADYVTNPASWDQLTMDQKLSACRTLALADLAYAVTHAGETVGETIGELSRAVYESGPSCVAEQLEKIANDFPDMAKAIYAVSDSVSND